MSEISYQSRKGRKFLSTKNHLPIRPSLGGGSLDLKKISPVSENESLKDFIQEELKFTSREVKKIIENEILKQFIQEKLHVSKKKIKDITKRKEIFLPISIFRNKLSTLEVVVKFLHKNKKLSFVEISSLLNRDQRTIWHAYQRSLRKKISLKVLDSSIKIPSSIFSNRNYSPLEILISRLKDSHKLKFTEIAALLELSPKTIWTVYQRYLKKNASKQ